MTARSILSAGQAPAGRPVGPLEGRIPEPVSAESERAEWGLIYASEFQNITVRTMVFAGASRQDAEDAVQEAFAAAIRKTDLLQTIDRKIAYVTQVARLQYLRRTRDVERRQQLMSELPERPQSDAGVEARAAEADSILQLLRSLDSPARDVIALKVDGYGTDEIASTLGIPVREVESRAHEARIRLRGLLNAEVNGEPATPTGLQSDDGSRGLAALPPRQREVLRLSREGYKPSQIAAVLSLTPNTARVNLYHARKRIRVGNAS